MTLFKQIALLISVVFLVLLGVILHGDLVRTGAFQQGQLQTTAQDMATTLGIAIGNLPEGDDEATLEALFNAVFDSGYYTRIELVGVDGNTIGAKSQALAIEGVPAWFLKLVPLDAALGSTQVMRGWNQLGRLELELHPGFAYSNMYQALKSALQWFLLLFVASMLVLWLVLRYLLQPLQRVTEQADAIRNNKFVQQDSLPSTTELKRVVEAMNLMVSKVQGIFDDQEKTLHNYQQLLYRDKLTSLGNRRYLLDRLQQALSEESGRLGSMAIVKILDFEQLRDRHGYELSDALVHIVAGLLRQPHAGLEAEHVSRFNDDEFAFLVSGSESSVEEYIRAMFLAFGDTVASETDLAEVVLVAGVCPLESGDAIGDILSGIDYCLSQAANRGPFTIERKISTSLALPQGKMQWRQWLDAMLETRQFFLVGQLAINTDGYPLQRELFIRARDQNEQVIPASAFMPMASSLGMALDIDREVFRIVAENRNLDLKTPLALNLSAAFFELAEAVEEFEQLLSDCAQAGRQLCIEASHHILVNHPLMCERISERARGHRHLFGIDNLDLAQSLQLLQSAQFDYVKINAKTLHEMSRNDMSAGYQALKTITGTLDIQIIAVGVDARSVYDELQAFGIEVMQGNFLGPPEAV